MNKILLILILILSLTVRLYHFNSPMADLHSWRQADTASVARNLVRSNLDVLHPQIESAVSIDGIGRDNTPRYHFAEFPLYQAAVAVINPVVMSLTKANLTDSIVLSGRVVSIVTSLLSIVALYLLTRRYYAEKVAMLAAFVYGLLPYSIFWSRAVLPDSMMLMFALFMLYWFDVWIKSDLHHKRLSFSPAFWLSCLCFAAALLLKAFVPFLLLPMVYLLWRRLGLNFYRSGVLWVFVLVSVLPFVLWRMWMQQWPFSIPASGWLFDGNRIRLKPAWWHWIVQVRLDQYMFNVTGLLLMGIGLFFYRDGFEHLHAKEHHTKLDSRWYLPLALFACFIYLVVFATGNVQHEYYQLPLTAFGSIFVAYGFWYLWYYAGTFFERSVRRLIAISFIFITLMLGWYSVKNWYSIGNPMLLTVGRRADAILPKDAWVLADYGGDTTFLYYVNRTGWSVRDKQLQEMIDRGAKYYISMHRNDYMNRLATLYEIVDETPEYVILDLTRRKGDWTGIAPYSL